MSIDVHFPKPVDLLLQMLTLTQSFYLSANEFHCLQLKSTFERRLLLRTYPNVKLSHITQTKEGHR